MKNSMKDKIKRTFPRLTRWVQNNKKMRDYQYRKNSTIQQKRKILEDTYMERIGVPLDLENPTRYTAKIQWTKLYGITDEMSYLSDKYRVREWVKKTIGEDYLLPLITSVKSFDEIDFNSLPSKFVIKSNNLCFLFFPTVACSARQLCCWQLYWMLQCCIVCVVDHTNEKQNWVHCCFTFFF